MVSLLLCALWAVVSAVPLSQLDRELVLSSSPSSLEVQLPRGHSVVLRAHTLDASAGDAFRFVARINEPLCARGIVCQNALWAPRYQAEAVAVDGNNGQILRVDSCSDLTVFLQLASRTRRNVRVALTHESVRDARDPCAIDNTTAGYLMGADTIVQPGGPVVLLKDRLRVDWFYANHSHKATQPVSVSLTCDGRPMSNTGMQLADTGTANVALTVPQDFAGSANCLVRVGALQSAQLSAYPETAKTPLTMEKLAVLFAVYSYGQMGTPNPDPFTVQGETFDVNVYPPYAATEETGTARSVILTSRVRPLVFVSQRGTQASFDDWWQNFDIRSRDCSPGIAECRGRVHAGFLNEYLKTRDALRSHLKAVMERGYTLVCTGHSQGGALAAITALDLGAHFKLAKDRVKLMTFASPILGDRDFVSQFPEHCSVNNRFLVNLDPVAASAPFGLSPLHHHAENGIKLAYSGTSIVNLIDRHETRWYVWAILRRPLPSGYVPVPLPDKLANPVSGPPDPVDQPPAVAPTGPPSTAGSINAPTESPLDRSFLLQIEFANAPSSSQMEKLISLIAVAASVQRSHVELETLGKVSTFLVLSADVQNLQNAVDLVKSRPQFFQEEASDPQFPVVRQASFRDASGGNGKNVAAIVAPTVILGLLLAAAMIVAAIWFTKRYRIKKSGGSKEDASSSELYERLVE